MIKWSLENLSSATLFCLIVLKFCLIILPDIITFENGSAKRCHYEKIYPDEINTGIGNNVIEIAGD